MPSSFRERISAISSSTSGVPCRGKSEIRPSSWNFCSTLWNRLLSGNAFWYATASSRSTSLPVGQMASTSLCFCHEHIFVHALLLDLDQSRSSSLAPAQSVQLGPCVVSVIDVEFLDLLRGRHPVLVPAHEGVVVLLGLLHLLAIERGHERTVGLVLVEPRRQPVVVGRETLLDVEQPGGGQDALGAADELGRADVPSGDRAAGSRPAACT